MTRISFIIVKYFSMTNLMNGKGDTGCKEMVGVTDLSLFLWRNSFIMEKYFPKPKAQFSFNFMVQNLKLNSQIKGD